MSVEFGTPGCSEQLFYLPSDSRAAWVQTFLARTQQGLSLLHRMLVDGSLEEYLRTHAPEKESTAKDGPDQTTAFEHIRALKLNESNKAPYEKVRETTKLHRSRLDWVLREFVPASGLEELHLGRKYVIGQVDFDPESKMLISLPGGDEVDPGSIVVEPRYYPQPPPEWHHLLKDIPSALPRQ